jgi:hypothetical protein
MTRLGWQHLVRTGAIGLPLCVTACGSSESTAPSASASAAPAKTAAAPPQSASASTENSAGVAELKDFKIFPEGPAKGHHFIAEIGIAKGPVVKDPMFRVNFKDADGTVVDTGSCAYRGVIKADDHVPCYGAIWKVPKWAKYDITVVPPQDIVPADSAPLQVSDTTLIAAKNQVDGKVTNTGKTAIKNVTAYVSFYGADGKIVGGNSANISGNDLEPGASAKFSVVADDVAAPPKTFYVKMSP